MKAVVFDMDGVIVDSEAHWKALEIGFYKTAAPKFKEKDCELMVGMGVLDVHCFLTQKRGMKMEEGEFLKRSDAVARRVYQEFVECAPGFLDLARELKHKGLGTAIASSSPRRWIDMVIERFRLKPLIDHIASADDVPDGRTKPHPDIYLEACSRLDVPTADCLAIEDSSIGVLSAKRAGLRVAALRTSHNQDQDLSLAHFELAGLDGLDYERLAARLRAT